MGRFVLRENSLQAGSQHGLRMLPQCLIDIEAGMAHYVACEPIALGHDVMKQCHQFMPGRSIKVARTTSGMRTCKRAFTIGLQRRAKVQTRVLSAKKPAWPEHENVRNEPSGHREGAALGAFQCDLLGEHDVSYRQLAHCPETQAEPRAAFFVDLADVRHGARIDPVLLAGLATDDFEISPFRELRPLRRRQPLPQKPQGPGLPECARRRV
jgi:hypothetical protein